MWKFFFSSVTPSILWIGTISDRFIFPITWKCVRHESRGWFPGCPRTSRSWNWAPGFLLPRCQSRSRRCPAAQRTGGGNISGGVVVVVVVFILTKIIMTIHKSHHHLTSLLIENSPPAIVGLWAGSQEWVLLFRSCSGRECQLNWARWWWW